MNQNMIGAYFHLGVSNQNMIGAYFHLGVSDFVCVVMFVYQFRLSVNPAGRIRFWHSSQFLISGFP